MQRRLAVISRDWQAATSGDGLWVVCRGARDGSARPNPLYQNAGVVLGTVFHRVSGTQSDATPRQAVLGPAETKHIVTSAGRELIASYWGQYVAFIIDAASGKRWVLKDPAGGLPCYCTTFEGVHIFFSRLQDCMNLGLPRLSIDWAFMTTRVAAGPARQSRTALREVRRVDSGECVQFSGDQTSRTYYWDPRGIARSDPVEDAHQAAVLLRDTTKACIHAWASCYESVVLRLSGGLDSSIVLGCLKSAPTRPRIVSVVYYVPRTTGADERTFARLAATDAKCELVEQDRTLFTLQFEQLLQAPLSPTPANHAASLEIGSTDRKIAHAVNAGALLTAAVGDGLFASTIHALAVTDYAQQHGLSTELLRIAAKNAQLARSSIWALVRQAVRDGVLSRKLLPEENPCELRTLVSDAVRESVRRQFSSLHPWFAPTEGVPPGKLLHMQLVLHAEARFYDPLMPENGPEELEPLASQPVIEAALRIPTYVLVNDGRNRGLARQAFVEAVPAQILARTWKGRPGDVFERHFQGHIRFIRELLLDGVLVRERLLDRRKLLATLSGPTKQEGGLMEIFDHLITEAWLRRWTDTSDPATAVRP